MIRQQLQLRIQAYCAELSRASANEPVDKIRNRLAYINSNVDALCALMEEDK